MKPTQPTPPRTTEQPGAVKKITPLQAFVKKFNGLPIEPPKPDPHLTMKTISQSCSDAELSAAVAEHVTGLKVYRTKSYGFSGQLEDDPPHLGLIIDSYKPIPPYATSADAVLPLLAKHKPGWGCDYDTVNYYVTLCDEHYDASCGVAPTFARAACFALLKSHGVTVADGKQEAGK